MGKKNEQKPMEIEESDHSADISTNTEENQKRGRQANASLPSPNHNASKLRRSANASDAKSGKNDKERTEKEEIRGGTKYIEQQGK